MHLLFQYQFPRIVYLTDISSDLLHIIDIVPI